MRIYLGARFLRRDELRLYAHKLTKLGYTITSRWLGGSHQMTPYSEIENQQYAEEDVDDLNSADMCIFFMEQPRELNDSRGGRHVELGMAIALNKYIVLIGPRENVFCYLPQIEHYDTFEDFVNANKMVS